MVGQNVWARAEVILDANGELLPAQVRREATRAGNEGGEAASKSFADSFREGVVPRLNTAFNSVRNSLRRMGGATDDARGKLSNLSDTMRRLSFRFGNTRPMIAFRLALAGVGNAAKNALGNIPGMLNSINDGLQKHQGMLESSISGWRRLSANTRQWTLIIGAVIASMSELAVLGSAAGSGLFVLGGAIAGMLPGLGVLIWSMSVLSRDLEDLPDSLQAARAGLTKFGNAWQKLGEEVAISVFTEAEGAFDSLADTVEGLTPAFKSLGTVVGRVFKNFTKSIAPGTEAFQNLSGLIEKSGPIFERVMGILGTLGAALLAAFNDPNFQRSISELLGWVEKLTAAFDTFLRGPGFDEWLNHGRDVFGAFGGLLETVGNLLNGMVTQETVDKLVAFIENIDTFLATGGKGILEFAEELDVFGLLADALAEIGTALEPLAEPMANFAEAINGVITAGIDKLGPVIEDIATALGPFVQGLADFMNENPQEIADLLLILAGAFVVFKGVQGIMGAASAMGGFITKMDDATKKAPTWNSVIGGALVGITASLPGTLDGEVSGNDVVNGFVTALVAGWLVGGPVGAAIGFVASLFTTMITDMFFDQTKGAWELGWEQIRAAGGDAIANFFADWQARIFAGFIGAAAIVTGAFVFLVERFTLGWQQIVDFFTVSVPGFFADWQGRILAGMVTVAASAQVGFETVKAKFELGWQQIVNFFTVEVPRFFTQAGNDVATGVGKIGDGFARAFPGVVSTVKYWIGVLEGVISAITDLINSVTGAAASAASAGGGGGRPALAQAMGGIHYGPTHVLMGEAGPEAIVPLRRPLSMVDPSVRWLSAIAQGKMPAMAGGGIVTGGRSVTVETINVNEAGDPRRAANDVITRLAEFVNG